MPAGKTAGRTRLRVRFAEFGWAAERVATLEHCTLPWFDESSTETSLEAVPLAATTHGGTREKLSLLGQFALHCAFLRFVGIHDADFDPLEWVVVRRRGSDSRLVRIKARQANGSGDLPIISTLEAFGRFVRLPSLQAFHRAWAKPEMVYHEIERRLRADARAADEWFRRSAIGWVRSPGPDAIGMLLSSSSALVYEDPDAPENIRRGHEMKNRDGLPILMFGGGDCSPVRRYSALAALGTLSGVDSEIAENAADRLPRAIALVVDPAAFDEGSRTVVQTLMRIAAGWSWAVPAETADWLSSDIKIDEASPSRLFIASPRVSTAEELGRELEQLAPAERRGWLNRFVRGEQFSAFLDHGSIPTLVASTAEVAEPRRSYLGALAILGTQVNAAAARELLKEIGCSLDLTELALPSIASLAGDQFDFASEQLRQRMAALLPPRSRQSLSSVAARILEHHGDPERAAQLYCAAAESEKALGLLEQGQCDGASLARFPASLLERSPLLSRRAAAALIDSGRYDDARRLGESAESPDRELLLARIERRLGNYNRAAAILDELTERSFAQGIAWGELLRLQGRFAEAREELLAAASLAGSEAERARAEYELAILARDCGEEPPPLAAIAGDPYLEGRWRSYVAMSEHDYPRARAEAERAGELASNIPDAIDAALDLLYAHFLAGEWDLARHQARRALTLVEETQGDRAAGGVLFTLVYLCADSGHWAEAEQAIERLRSFYRDAGDERRLSELPMLAAHLALCRGQFASARQHLSAGADRRWSSEIREAAHLVLDELDWIDGKLSLARTSGDSGCIELSRRHELNVARALGRAGADRLDGFSSALLRWENAFLRGELSEPPLAPSRTARLRLYRSAVGLLRRRDDEALDSLARQIALEMRIDHRPHQSEEGLFACELQLLQLLGGRRFPFEESDLGDFRWRYVSRNRLGQWSQIGSLPHLQPAELARLDLSLPPDWVSCSDLSFLFIEGLDQFSAKSREAVRSMFALQAELYRLQRVAEQEQLIVADKPAPTAEGVLGDSPAIRELSVMVEKLARRDVPVCILGESGTGKELFARAIHLRSLRRAKAFTAINCAALPENLVESELFGHARGAFTGADRDRAGILEITDGGTLFLDEIGELPLAAQAKLLRFLQEGEFRRVGETVVRRADVRVIAATNRKLEACVDEGSFREDLYYRIRGIELQVPPLRERGSDILLLARHFLAGERERHRGGADRLSDDVEAVLLSYSWPGNVRELENTIRAAHALAGEKRMIEVEHLPERLQSVLIVRAAKGTYYEELQRFRRGLIERSLADARGNQNRAAKALGMTRQALAYQIRELGILVREHSK